ncbi:hypothetical protein BH09ACT1_BH09ACT1_19830 [soil metagenome]
MAKHLATDTKSPLSAVRRFFSIRKMISTAGVLVAAIALALFATSGSYALWNKSVPAVSSSTITSGSASLAITSALAVPSTPMYPGLTIYAPATVSNTGSVDLALTAKLTGPATATTYSAALTIGMATATSAANCSAGTVDSSWSTATFASPNVATFGSTLPDASTGNVICVSITLASTVAASAEGAAASSFSIALTGTQA